MHCTIHENDHLYLFTSVDETSSSSSSDACEADFDDDDDDNWFYGTDRDDKKEEPLVNFRVD